MFKRYLSFVRSGLLDILAWACVAFLFVIWLEQSIKAHL